MAYDSHEFIDLSDRAVEYEAPRVPIYVQLPEVFAQRHFFHSSDMSHEIIGVAEVIVLIEYLFGQWAYTVEAEDGSHVNKPHQHIRIEFQVGTNTGKKSPNAKAT